MCARPSERGAAALLLLLSGCATQPDQPLQAVELGLAQEAAYVAGPSVTATLLSAAMASEACAGQDGLWDDVVVGDSPPFSARLSAALGADAQVSALSRANATSVTLEIEGARLLGWSGLALELDAEGDGEGLELGLVAVMDGERVGESSASVLQGCADVPRVSGSAEWTDPAGRAHTLSYPLSASEELILDGDIPWLPTAGDLRWEALVREVANSLETAEADQLTIDESADPPTATWPAIVTSQGWSNDATVPIAP